MRQWQVNPKVLCTSHLLGEHVEHHMMLGVLARGNSIDKYLDGLFDPSILVKRHEMLAKEMLRRGMKHNSPLCPDQLAKVELPIGHVNVLESYHELSQRCRTCHRRISKFQAGGSL